MSAASRAPDNRPCTPALPPGTLMTFTCSMRTRPSTSAAVRSNRKIPRFIAALSDGMRPRLCRCLLRLAAGAAFVGMRRIDRGGLFDRSLDLLGAPLLPQVAARQRQLRGIVGPALQRLAFGQGFQLALPGAAHAGDAEIALAQHVPIVIRDGALADLRDMVLHAHEVRGRGIDLVAIELAAEDFRGQLVAVLDTLGEACLAPLEIERRLFLGQAHGRDRELDMAMVVDRDPPGEELAIER